MALSSTTEWEVRTTGSDLNSGGYNPSRSGAGVDRSQQDAAHASGTNMQISATLTTDVTPDGYTPTTDDIGNIVQITGGTGFTAGFYEITSIQSGQWRLDRAVGTVSSSGGAWSMGGALATPGFMGSILSSTNQNSAGQIVHIKNGVYLMSGAANSSGGPVAVTSAHIWLGYENTRLDDGEPPTFQANDNSLTLFNSTSGNYALLRNFKFLNTGFTSVLGLRIGSSASRAEWLEFAGMTNGSIYNTGNNNSYFDCYVNGSSGSQGAFYTAGVCSVFRCVVKNSGVGFYFIAVDLCYVRDCVVYRQSGMTRAVSFAVTTSSTVYLSNCISHYSSIGFSATGRMLTEGCISSDSSSTGFFSNTTRVFRKNCATYLSGGSDSEVAYDDNSIILTEQPFTDPDNGDFTLNNAAGGGELLKGIATTIPGLPGVSFRDVGAYQRAGGSTVTSGPRVLNNQSIEMG